MKRSVLTFTVFILFLLCLLSSKGVSKERDRSSSMMEVPILLYHRFGPVVADCMTVTGTVFESQLKYLKDHGYTVIPLRQLIDYYSGKTQKLPLPSVVITVDDGHKSVYTDMFPLLMTYRLPVTLLLYPSAISNASYAMTWGQLREMKTTGLVDFHSHTFWHPNFRQDKRRLDPVAYEDFVDMQLTKSKWKLEEELNTKVDMLAWPFGIYDDELIHKAAKAGYVAALTIERHHATPSDKVMALPRYLITNADTGKSWERILAVSPKE